jgi:hypothetical protein
MSEDDADALLRQDVESYMCGGEPSPAELADAPVIADWEFEVIQLTGEAGVTFRGVLIGHVNGHPRLPDGSKIRASELVWINRKERWARTWNRVYKLGERAVEPTPSA